VPFDDPRMTTGHQPDPPTMTAAPQTPAPRDPETRAPSSSPQGTHPVPRVSGWVGWIWFAGAMCLMVGGANIVNGLIALFDDEYYTVTATGELLVWDFTAWGWIHLIVGALLMVLGGFLFANPNPVVRTAAVLLAGLNVLAQLTYLGVYPVFAIVTITLDVLVIWALLVHGQEVEDDL